jgi:hypothetical protein
MNRFVYVVFATIVTSGPLAAQSAPTTPVSRGMEIQVQLPGDSAWHTANVGVISKSDDYCLMVRLAPVDSTTGDFYFKRFAGIVAVRTKNAKGEWHDIPEAELAALQGCTLE